MTRNALRTIVLFVLLSILAACAQQTSAPLPELELTDLTSTPATVDAAPTSTAVPPTAVPSPVDEPGATAETLPTSVPEPTATTTPPVSRLTVCMVEPPVPLNPYATTGTSQTVLSALNDGPIDRRNFAYKGVLLADTSDASSDSLRIEETAVAEGDRVYNRQTGQIETYQGSGMTLPQMRVRFQMRPDINWSDGQLLTARDSVYAFQLLTEAFQAGLLNPGSPAEQMIASTMDYQVVDEQTIEWVGLPGLITRDYLSYFFPPLPEHLDATLETDSPPVGWGAFQLEEWIPGQHLRVTRNPAYFRASEGLPLLDEIEFLFFEPPLTDLPQRVGEAHCDVIGQSLVYALSVEAWRDAVEGTDFILTTSPSVSGLQLLFNQAGESPTQNEAVRQAIAACIDRPALADSLQGTVAISYLHPLDTAFLELAWPEHSPEAATALLSDLGQQEDIPLTLVARDSVSGTGEAIVADLTECGFSVEASYLPAEEFFAPWPDGSVFGGQYDLVLFPLNTAARDACSTFSSKATPSVSLPQGSNVFGWRSDAFDQACAQVELSIDSEESLQFEREAQQLWRDEMSALPLLWYSNYAVIDCHVVGYELDPVATELWNIEEISLAETCDS